MNGAVTAPTLTLATTDNITYSVDSDPPYAAGGRVVVTATLNATGVGWPAVLPTGWTRTGDTTATYTVNFASVTCTPVSPVDPAVTQATCANGAVTSPVITLPITTGLIYSTDTSDISDGTKSYTVTITATITDGYTFGQLNNWQPVANDPTRATLQIQLTGASCTAVMPAAPSVVEAVCVNGAVTAPTLTLATTDGVTYSVDSNPPYVAGGRVVVTATLNATGVAWPPTLPTGWTRTGNTTATYTVNFASVTCKPVSPVNPTVTQATCTNGAVTSPIITLPVTTGLIYSTDADDISDGTKDHLVTITATTRRRLPVRTTQRLGPRQQRPDQSHPASPTERCVVHGDDTGGADGGGGGLCERFGDGADVDVGDHGQRHLQRR